MIKHRAYLLGPPTIEWQSDEPPRVRSPRTLALLGYLAAERRVISRDMLASLFWPDESTSAARAHLRRELHVLGTLLPHCWRTDRKTVEFTPGAETWIDIDEFGQLEEAKEWEEAADLTTGVFLEGLYLDDNLQFESWLLGERERWHQRTERVLRRAVARKASVGDLAGALRLARRLLHQMPWHEAMHRQVMRLLAQRGQRSAALRQFEQCKHALQNELGVDVSPETQALYERIRDAGTFTDHNIPAPTTPLIGRERELEQLHRWLKEPTTRLITITGAGGMGKSRLAHALAQQLLDQPLHSFGDGIYLVSLAGIENPSYILPTLASALHFRLHGEHERSPRQQLLHYLQTKRMLLLFDNFEHVLEGADIVTDILSTAPDIQIVATSRERLRLRGEQNFPLLGLDYDEPTVGRDKEVEESARPAANQLFVTAARRVHPGLQLDPEEEEELSRICRLVEGMPLALELAATSADALSLSAMAAEIERGLDFLKSDLRDVPPRHRSMRAAFDTTWRRLSAEEQQVFAALTVFRGGFTLAAAETVTGASAPLLSRLVARSLLRYELDSQRYQIHELLRQFGASHRQTHDPDEHVKLAHCRYFAQISADAERRSLGFFLGDLTNQLRIELDNIRQAWNYAVGLGLARYLAQMARSITTLYTLQGIQPRALIQEAIQSLQHRGVASTDREMLYLKFVALDLLAGSDPATAREQLINMASLVATHGNAELCYWIYDRLTAMHDGLESLDWAEKAQQVAYTLEDEALVKRSEIIVILFRHALAPTDTLFLHEYLAFLNYLESHFPDSGIISLILWNLAENYAREEAYQQALVYGERRLRIAIDAQDLFWISRALNWLAWLYLEMELPQRARRCLLDQLDWHLDIGQVWQTLGCLYTVTVYYRQFFDDSEIVVPVLSMVYHHPEVLPLYKQDIQKTLPHAEAELGTDAFTAAWEAGKHLDFDTAVARVREALTLENVGQHGEEPVASAP